MVHDQNRRSLLTEFIGVFAINAPDENVSHPWCPGTGCAVQHICNLMMSCSSRLLHPVVRRSRNRKALCLNFSTASGDGTRSEGEVLQIVYRRMQKIIRGGFGMDNFDPSEAIMVGDGVRLPGILGRWFDQPENTSCCSPPRQRGFLTDVQRPTGGWNGGYDGEGVGLVNQRQRVSLIGLETGIVNLEAGRWMWGCGSTKTGVRGRHYG
jgi:hypothetical protein